MLKTTQKGASGIVLLLIILVIIFASGFFFLLGRDYYQTETQPTPNLPSPTSSVRTSSPSASELPKSNLPAEWTYTKSKYCGISLPMPPNKPPYVIPAPAGSEGNFLNDEGGIWRFYEGTLSSNSEPFNYNLSISYSHPTPPGTDYTPGLVIIRCSSNQNNLTLDQLLSTYQRPYVDGTFTGLKITSKEKVKMWGFDVYKVHIEGGMYRETDFNYLVATKSYIYGINAVSMSPHNEIQNTTKTIFDNLQFN